MMRVHTHTYIYRYATKSVVFVVFVVGVG